MLNNRLTSSINRAPARDSAFKFELIAKEILKRHISLSDPSVQGQTGRLSSFRKTVRDNH